MKSRRIELFALFALLLVANWVALLWLQSGPASTALANVLAQPTPPPARIPQTFSYQGVLRRADGSLEDSTVKITLRIYDKVLGGEPEYTEVFEQVVVRDGLFNLVVGDKEGSSLPGDLFIKAPLYMGISLGDNAEMLPRQRLHPVPWAMQSSTAVTAATAESLKQGGGVPGLVRLGAGGKEEIAFESGGKITAAQGGLTIEGDLTVNGEWSRTAIHHVGDQYGKITPSSYPVSINRYVVEAKDGGSTFNSVLIDDDLLVQLCGDEDGCTLHLGMREWGAELNGTGLLAMLGPWRFSLGQKQSVGGKQTRLWRSEGFDIFGNRRVFLRRDGDGSPDSPMIAWDCNFTDGFYESGIEREDHELGFFLLNTHINYPNPKMVCVLIIED